MATAWPHTLFPVIANRRAVKQSTGTALPTCAHTKAWALHWNATLVLPERYLLAGCGGVFRAHLLLWLYLVMPMYYLKVALPQGVMPDILQNAASTMTGNP